MTPKAADAASILVIPRKVISQKSKIRRKNSSAWKKQVVIKFSSTYISNEGVHRKENLIL